MLPKQVNLGDDKEVLSWLLKWHASNLDDPKDDLETKVLRMKQSVFLVRRYQNITSPPVIK
jgi:hypothetical protein